MEVDTMRKLLTALVAAASIGAAAIATSSSAEAWRGAGVGGVPGVWVGESLPVLSSEAQSRRGRIITTRMATTDTDHILIMDRPAAACGTATPGCLLASNLTKAAGFDL